MGCGRVAIFSLTRSQILFEQLCLGSSIYINLLP